MSAATPETQNFLGTQGERRSGTTSESVNEEEEDSLPGKICGPCTVDVCSARVIIITAYT